MQKSGSRCRIAMKWLLLLPMAILLALAFRQLVELPPETALPPPARAAQGVLSGLTDALPPEPSPVPYRTERLAAWWFAHAELNISLPPPCPPADSQGIPLPARQYRRSCYLAFPPGDMPG